jgi:hypothetical protein
MALIIDSPWIPGHMKISHMEYYLNPEAWFHSNLHIQNEFADIILCRHGGWNLAWLPNLLLWVPK